MQVAQFASGRLRCRLSSGWEPETWGHELPTHLFTKTHKDWWHRTGGWTLGERGGVGDSKEELDMRAIIIQGYKSPGILLLAILLLSTSSICFCITVPWINCFMELDIWDYAMGNLAWTDKETWSDCKWGTHQLTGADHCKGTSVPGVKVSSIGSVAAREFCWWSDWQVSWTLTNQKWVK